MPNQHSDTRIAPTAPEDPSPHRATDIGVGHGLSAWPVVRRSATAQRRGRFVAGSSVHSARMLPDRAAHAIHNYCEPGDIVLDPLPGVGATVMEAMHAGRNAVGSEVHAGHLRPQASSASGRRTAVSAAP